jgi:hypothetical protein
MARKKELQSAKSYFEQFRNPYNTLTPTLSMQELEDAVEEAWEDCAYKDMLALFAEVIYRLEQENAQLKSKKKKENQQID